MGLEARPGRIGLTTAATTATVGCAFANGARGVGQCHSTSLARLEMDVQFGVQ